MDNSSIFENLTSWIAPTLTAIGSGFATYVFARRKNNADAKKSELDNVEQAISIWKGIAADLEGRFMAMQKQVNDMQKEIMKLEIENEKYKSEIEILKNKIQHYENTTNIPRYVDRSSDN